MIMVQLLGNHRFACSEMARFVISGFGAPVDVVQDWPRGTRPARSPGWYLGELRNTNEDSLPTLSKSTGEYGTVR
jgi:hypothetical protein